MTKCKESDQKKFDQLAALLRDTSPDRLRTLLVKTATVMIRVTAADKMAMKEAARACGCSLTEYITALHHAAAGKIRGK